MSAHDNGVSVSFIFLKKELHTWKLAHIHDLLNMLIVNGFV